jgi:hypothetical protein
LAVTVPAIHISRDRAAAAAVAVLALVAGCSFDRGLEPPASRSAGPAPGKAAPLFTHDWVSQPRRFASGLRVTSFAATPSRLLGATVGSAPAKLVTFTETGGIAPFAPHFAPPSELACLLEIAAGVGDFAPDAVFVACGSDLWQLPEDGSTASRLASLPAADGAITALRSDTTGGLGFDLVALTTGGGLFRIAADGRVERVGDAGPGARGLAIASNRLTAFAGQVLVAFPAASEVRALNGAGQWSLVTRWSGVSGLASIPEYPRAFGATGAACFLATEGGDVHGFPVSDLVGRGGEVVMTTDHASGSGLIVPQGTGYMTRPFGPFVGREVAVAMVRRPAVQSVRIDIWPGSAGSAITIGSDALVPVAVMAGIGFATADLDRGDLTLAGAAPVPIGRRSIGCRFDFDADGRLDLLLCFRAAEMQLEPGERTLQLDAVMPDGDRVRGRDRTLVVTP